MKITSIILFSGFAVAGLLLAAPSPAPRALASGESLLRKDGQVMLVREGKATLLEDEVTVAGGGKMMSKRVFTLKRGKERGIKKRQSLNVGGALTNAGGT